MYMVQPSSSIEYIAVKIDSSKSIGLIYLARFHTFRKSFIIYIEKKVQFTATVVVLQLLLDAVVPNSKT